MEEREVVRSTACRNEGMASEELLSPNDADVSAKDEVVAEGEHDDDTSGDRAL